MSDTDRNEFSIAWRKRTEFAELAEALGIDSDLIMASMPSGAEGAVLVMYSRGGELTDPVRYAHLRRDSSGVLYVALDEPSGKTVADHLPPMPPRRG